jgi:hypothetical protein
MDPGALAIAWHLHQHFNVVLVGSAAVAVQTQAKEIKPHDLDLEIIGADRNQLDLRCKRLSMNHHCLYDGLSFWRENQKLIDLIPKACKRSKNWEKNCEVRSISGHVLNVATKAYLCDLYSSNYRGVEDNIKLRALGCKPPVAHEKPMSKLLGEVLEPSEYDSDADSLMPDAAGFQ